MSDKRNGHLFVISSVSGGGKTTVIDRLMRGDPSLVLSVSHTTRPPRGREKDGVDYHFVTREAFEKMVAAGAFLEWARVYGNLYGTTRTAVESELSHGRDVLLDIDVQGAEQVKRIIPGAVTIFLVPPSLTELERRLRSRGTDSQEAMEKRLAAAHTELANQSQYDYSVLNDDLDTAVEQVAGIIRKTRGEEADGIESDTGR